MNKPVTFVHVEYPKSGGVAFREYEGWLCDEPGWDGRIFNYIDQANAARNGFHLTRESALAWELSYWGEQLSRARDRVAALLEAGAPASAGARS